MGTCDIAAGLRVNDGKSSGVPLFVDPDSTGDLAPHALAAAVNTGVAARDNGDETTFIAERFPSTSPADQSVTGR